MVERSVPLTDPRRATTLPRSLARFELLLGVAVGLTWGPLIFHFLLHITDWTRPLISVTVLGFILGLGTIGARAPSGYFRLRSWERAKSGHIYVRYFGIRSFKRWMSHGDRMNAWLRKRSVGYRVVGASPAAAAAYAVRTMEIERAHLAWGLAALAPLGYALAVEAYGFSALWALANTVTNAWPVLLQRYNRVRAENIARRVHRG